MAEISKFPFQTQISYIALDGSKRLRVITQQQDVCNERQEVQKNADYDMVNFHCMNKCAQMARSGNISKGMAIAKGFKRGMQSNTYTP